MDPMSHDCGECTHSGRKCIWQLQTETEAQRVLQEPAKQDAGLGGKQQMGSTRSPMPTLLPDQILYEPARIAVKVLLELRNHLPTLAMFHWNSLSQDARLLLDGCRDLQNGLQQPPSCTELEGYALSLLPMLVESYTGAIVPNLSHATRLKLSIIVWHFHAPSCKPSPGPVASHFDASSYEPTQGLVTFLRSPLNKEVWEILHVRYQRMCQLVPFDDFMRSFDFLLSSQLPQEPPTNQRESGIVNFSFSLLER